MRQMIQASQGSQWWRRRPFAVPTKALAHRHATLVALAQFRASPKLAVAYPDGAAVAYPGALVAAQKLRIAAPIS